MAFFHHKFFFQARAALTEARTRGGDYGVTEEAETRFEYRVIFLTGPPLKMSLDWPPPNLLGLAPPLISLSVGITFTSPDT